MALCLLGCGGQGGGVTTDGAPQRDAAMRERGNDPATDASAADTRDANDAAADASAADRPAVGCAFGTLAQERAYYASRGWMWTPPQEPHGPPKSGSSYMPSHEDVHGDMEADDLWQNLQMWRRTGVVGYFDLARSWARYFRDEYPTSPALMDDLGGFGGDHLFGWGLIEWWRLTGDAKAREAAKTLGGYVEEFDKQRDASPKDTPFAHWARYWSATPNRQVGRHLHLVVELWLATGEARWKTLADKIVAALLTSPAWDARGAWLSPRANSDGVTYAKAISPLHLAIIGDALWRYWELTKDVDVATRLVEVAKFARSYGLHDERQYTGNFIALDHRKPGDVFHGYIDNGIPPFGVPSQLTASLADTLLRGWRLTGDETLRARAYLHWERASKYLRWNADTATFERAPDGEVGRFVNVQNGKNGGSGYLSDTPYFYENGDLNYTWMLFAEVAAPCTEPAPPKP